MNQPGGPEPQMILAMLCAPLAAVYGWYTLRAAVALLLGI